jgi:hypothetical protein
LRGNAARIRDGNFDRYLRGWGIGWKLTKGCLHVHVMGDDVDLLPPALALQINPDVDREWLFGKCFCIFLAGPAGHRLASSLLSVAQGSPSPIHAIWMPLWLAAELLACFLPRPCAPRHFFLPAGPITHLGRDVPVAPVLFACLADREVLSSDDGGPELFGLEKINSQQWLSPMAYAWAPLRKLAQSQCHRARPIRLDSS